MSFLLDCLYLVAGTCLLPYWLWKLPTARRYRSGILQRLGFAPKAYPRGSRRLWVHCASVGEASLPARLLTELKQRYPDWQIVFSTNTDTGAARLRELYPGSSVFYMPLDFSPCVRMALRRVRPDLVMLVELELWPNFAEVCRLLGVPMAIINGRIGPGSRRLLRLLSRLWPPLWGAVRLCCARSQQDAAGFVDAGLPADRIFDCGMLKCDGLAAQPDADREGHLRAVFAIQADAPVLVAGSTHRGEEAILGAAYRDLKIGHRSLRMVVAPRHIERAAEVIAALRARGLPVASKTALDTGAARALGDEVIVLDTIGDLVACYGLATCAFVGRSLVPPGGGQNVMEPAALGKPVLTGLYTANFRPEMSLLKAVGAALVVRDHVELRRDIDRLLSSPGLAERMGTAGRAVVLHARGATLRTMEKLEPLLRSAR